MQHRILTVDDDSDARLAVQRILERQQMHVATAESAEDGLSALSSSNFDLVITDFRMRWKTGLDLVRETRDRGIGVPFILLTAETDLAIRNMAAELGRHRGTEQASTTAVSAGSRWPSPIDGGLTAPQLASSIVSRDVGRTHGELEPQRELQSDRELFFWTITPGLFPILRGSVRAR
jgi:CheY-like chemotaxis protein